MDIYKARRLQKKIGVLKSKDKDGNIVGATYTLTGFDHDNKLVYYAISTLTKELSFVINDEAIEQFIHQRELGIRILFESKYDRPCISYVIPID